MIKPLRRPADALQDLLLSESVQSRIYGSTAADGQEISGRDECQRL